MYPKNYLALILFTLLTIIGGKAYAQPNDPGTFASTVISSGQIDLSFSLNVASDNVVIAWSNSATFGVPTGTYTVGQSITGGGTVLFVGNTPLTFSHTFLAANTTYYYKIWSVDGAPLYSTGLTTNAKTLKSEPSYHVSGFTSPSQTNTSITLSWNDSQGSMLPDSYLVIGSTTSLAAITSPIDGTPQADDVLIKNIAFGVKTAVFSGLTPSTNYYFKIFPYSNSGSNSNYKTNSIIPNYSGATPQTPITISLSDDGTITEALENTEVISITVSDGLLQSSLNESNWVVSNLPAGVSRSILTRVDDTHATFQLVGTRTTDYDVNITNLTVTVASAEFTSGLNAASDNSGVVFTAINDAESIAMVSDGTINEGAENGELITVDLTGGTFADPLVTGNWTLTGGPTGVGISNLIRVSATQATFTLNGNRTVDYSSDITTMQLNINQADVDDYAVADLTVATGVTFIAASESAALSHAGLTEQNLNTAVVTINLTGTTFIDGTLSSSNFVLNNAPTGTTISGVSWASSTQGTVTLAFDSTDFDANITNFSVTIAAAELSCGIALNTNTLTITAISESATLSHAGLTELNLNTAVVTVDLVNTTFIDGTLSAANFTLNNAPSGTTINAVNYVSGSQATVTLAFDGTNFDATINNFNITVAAVELSCHSAIITSNLTITTISESANLSHAGLTELNLNTAIITVDLVNTTFIDGTLSASNFTLNNAPNGTTINGVSWASSTKATVTLAFDSTDFDLTITNFNITIAAAELSCLSSITSTDLTIAAVNETAALSFSGSLSESNLNTAVITIDLSNTSFIDGTLSASNFTLNNAPSGTTINAVNYTSTSQATVTLAFNGTDFDVDITNFNITIAAAEISCHSVITSSDLSITAVDDVEAITLAWSNPPATNGAEATLNSDELTVSLSGGTFISGQINTTNITATGNATTAAGVSIESVSFIDASSVKVLLAWNGMDFDTDKELVINIASSAISGSTGVLTDTINIIATDEGAESISLGVKSINEASENGQTIVVTLVNGSFTSTLTPANWTLTNLPLGVSLGSITRNSNTQVTITLAGNRTQDYDADITNFTVECADAEVDDNNSSLSANTGITFAALNDAESIALTWGAVPGTNGAEVGMNSEVVRMTITGGTFISSAVNTSNITASGTATSSGVSIESVTYVNPTAVDIAIAWNGTDYDVDKLLTISVATAAFDVADAILTANINLVATDEAAAITLSNNAPINEGAEDAGIIVVTLAEDQFVGALTQANWTVNNLPAGVTQGTVTRTGNTSATIALVGNRTIDYDANITNIQVVVNGAEFVVHTLQTDATANSGFTLTALNDAEVITMAYDGTISEGLENAEVINVTLSGGTFADPLNASNWGISGGPTGVSISNLVRNSATSATFTLSGNRTADYDVDITNMTLSIAAADIDDVASGSVSTNTGVVFTAIVESAALTATLDETTLNGNTITMTLTNTSFADATLSPSNFTLNNAPLGLSIASVSHTSSTIAVATLAFDGTDFDADILNLTITIATAELTTPGNVISNATTITAVNDVESIVAAWSGTPGTNGLEASMDAEVVIVTLTNGTFTSGQINATNITLSGTAITEAGISLESVTYNSAHQITLLLAWNGQDFDANKTLTVNIAAVAFTSSDGALTSSLTLTATNDDPESITIAGGPIAEGAENGNTIVVTAVNGTFKNPLTVGNWSLTNAPVGVTIGSITRTSLTTADLVLSGNRTVDYDANLTLTVSCTEAEVDDYSGVDLSASGVVFTADNDAESILMADDGLITEGSENGEQVTLTLTGGTFVATPTLANFSFSNLPTGVSVASVSRITPTTARLTLSGNTSIDYDVNITNFTVTIPESEVDDYTGADFVISTGVTFVAVLEPNLNVSVTSLTNFGLVTIGSSSTEQSYTVSGSDLSGDIIVTPPTGFEISLTSGSNWVTTSLTLSQASGIVNTTTIYVRFTPLTGGNFSGNITHATAGHAGKNVDVSGFGNAVGTAKVRITEVADYYGDGNKDYIEIYNAGTAAVDITGYVLKSHYAGDNSSEQSITLSSGNQRNTGGSNYMILEAGEFALIVHSDYAGLKSAYSIGSDVAIFGTGSVPTIDGYERYQLESGAKAVLDNYGTYNDFNTFSLTPNYSYERNSPSSTDGTIESSWQSTDIQSYTYTPAGNNFNPLPIELVSFTCAIVNNDCRISWQTASEKNNQFFTLKRAINNQDFSEIATVNGAGNSLEKLNYSFIDKNVGEGNLYYQLSQTDFDGKTKIIGTIKVTYFENRSFEISKAYFNQDNLNVDIENASYQKVTVVVYDITGREMYRTVVNPTTDNEHIVLNLDGNLPNQQYIARFSTALHTISKKIMK